MPVVYDAILPHVTPFILTLTRVAGLFMFAPLLSSVAIPRQVKVVLILALTLCVYPTVDPTPALEIRPGLYELAPLLVTEALIGASIGLLANMPLWFVQLGGLLMGMQMGLGIAQILNPATQIEGDNLGQTLFLMTLAAFTLAGGVELLYGALVHTFATVPLTTFGLERAPLDLIVGLTQAGFDLALRIAMPVLVIIFLENIALGFIMKTVPSLNILSFGFPIRIIVGLMVFVAATDFIAYAIAGDVEHVMDLVQQWVALGAPAPSEGP